jgi:hypothetical protein
VITFLQDNKQGVHRFEHHGRGLGGASATSDGGYFAELFGEESDDEVRIAIRNGTNDERRSAIARVRVRT